MTIGLFPAPILKGVEGLATDATCGPVGSAPTPNQESLAAARSRPDKPGLGAATAHARPTGSEQAQPFPATERHATSAGCWLWISWTS